jgi:two-component system, cell cycle response regulator CpdR
MVKVLLADDDAAMRDVASRALGSDGHAVVVVHDGQEALERATAASPPFDILVTDVQMPVLDGITLVEQLLAIQPGLRVVLMSGLQSEMARADRLKGPNTHFLLKPFTLEQLRATVRRALA